MLGCMYKERGFCSLRHWAVSCVRSAKHQKGLNFCADQFEQNQIALSRSLQVRLIHPAKSNQAQNCQAVNFNGRKQCILNAVEKMRDHVCSY